MGLNHSDKHTAIVGINRVRAMVSEKERCAILETGTGFAGAKLSEGQKPCPLLALLALSG
jgi:hypothetical protein